MSTNIAPAMHCYNRQFATHEPARLRLEGHAVVPGADPGDPSRVSKHLVLVHRDLEYERRLPLPNLEAKELPLGVGSFVWSQCAGFAIDFDMADPELALHEGSWDLYVDTEVGVAPPYRQRLAADRAGQPYHVHTSIQHRGDHRYLAYLTVNGNVSLMIRGLSGHVEVNHILVDGDMVRVSGELTGADDAGGVPVIIRRRSDDATVALATSWSGRSVEATVNLVELAARDEQAASGKGSRARQHWDVILPANGDDIAFASYFDDVHHKQHVMVYPTRVVSVGGGIRPMQPCFTVHNTVAITSGKAAAE
ncbi:MAG: hypothetical protein ACRDT8_05465 [Micromonosporaceae bacterium]